MSHAGRRALLLLLPATAPSKLQEYLHSIVSVYGMEEVILVGKDEDVLKKTKMDCYTVAGKTERNVSVRTHVITSSQDTAELANTIEQLASGTLFGVLLCQQSSTIMHTGDILDMDTDDISRDWLSTMIPLHATARQTIPLLSRAITNTSTPSQRPFFLIDPRPEATNVNPFHTAIQSSLLESIIRSPAATGVTIGYAHDILPPPRKPVEKAALPLAIDIPVRQANGTGLGGIGQGALTPGALTPGSGESPTKLWNLWAMSQEPGALG